MDFTYNMSDIDNISQELGIPWETSKDIPFSSTPLFIGFIWDLDCRTVQLSEPKCMKYITAIDNWSLSCTHVLEDVQKLHGKLVHAALIFPEGKPYLTSLERMLGIFGDEPFKPRTPPRGTMEDLKWWQDKLSSPSIPRPIRSPQPILDLQAFSDASSSIGLGITLGDRWRAWFLRPGWASDGRDIGWAESIGLKLLVNTILRAGTSNCHFPVHCDNQVLRNSCPYTTYPTFSSPPIEHPISPSTNSLLHRTDTGICPHSSSTPRPSKQNPVPIIDASSCFTFLVLIRLALPPVLWSAGLHLVPRMFSSLDSAAAPHSLRSTGPPFRFPFLHRTILHLFLSLVQRCGSLP